MLHAAHAGRTDCRESRCQLSRINFSFGRFWSFLTHCEFQLCIFSRDPPSVKSHCSQLQTKYIYIPHEMIETLLSPIFRLFLSQFYEGWSSRMKHLCELPVLLTLVLRHLQILVFNPPCAQSCCLEAVVVVDSNSYLNFPRGEIKTCSQSKR